MPIRHCIVHLIDKKPDGTPAVLHARDSELAESAAIENMLADLNESYNAKQGKAWGLFHAESGAHPFSGWLKEYLDGGKDFTAFSRIAVEHLQKLMEESNLSTGGHVLFAHYQQGMTDYLAIALLHHSEGVAVTDQLDVTPSRHLDLGQLHLAARINLSEWQNNKQSKQYISFIKGKNGKKVSEYFRDFIGCQEGVDGPGETRTLLKAFSDFVESEDLPEDSAREKTKTLVDYASSQAKLGEPMGLEELSELIDEERPKPSTITSATRTTACHRRSRRTNAPSTSSAVSPAAPRACPSASKRTCWAPRSSTTKKPAPWSSRACQPPHRPAQASQLMLAGALKKVLLIVLVLVVYQNWGKIERWFNPLKWSPSRSGPAPGSCSTPPTGAATAS